MAVGSEADQFRRLDHIVEAHGVDVIPCRSCRGEGCADCDDLGMAFEAPPGWDKPCCPSCPLLEARPV